MFCLPSQSFRDPLLSGFLPGSLSPKLITLNSEPNPAAKAPHNPPPFRGKTKCLDLGRSARKISVLQRLLNASVLPSFLSESLGHWFFSLFVKQDFFPRKKTRSSGAILPKIYRFRRWVYGVFLVSSPPQANIFGVLCVNNKFVFDFHASVRKFSEIHKKNLVTTKKFLAETRNLENFLVSNEKKTLIQPMSQLDFLFLALASFPLPDVWKIKFRISEAILERLEGQNVSK